MESSLSEDKVLNAYSDAIEYYAKESTNALFFNKGNEHAIIVFRTIFRYAKERIFIVAKNLNNSVTKSDDYLQAMRSFLDKKNTKLDVLISEYDDSGNDLFSLLKKYPEQVKIRCTEGKLFTNQDGEDIHFCVADGHMYRLETNIMERKASCNFNDPTVCKSLIKNFLSVFNSSSSSVVYLA